MWSRAEEFFIMTEQTPFKWRHFEAEIILVCVRWYLRSAASQSLQ
jgi:transposase-like protein